MQASCCDHIECSSGNCYVHSSWVARVFMPSGSPCASLFYRVGIQWGASLVHQQSWRLLCAFSSTKPICHSKVQATREAAYNEIEEPRGMTTMVACKSIDLATLYFSVLRSWVSRVRMPSASRSASLVYRLGRLHVAMSNRGDSCAQSAYQTDSSL